jgi:dipeptidyl aminopeptidase/acylaminoacyl peptidase
MGRPLRSSLVIGGTLLMALVSRHQVTVLKASAGQAPSTANRRPPIAVTSKDATQIGNGAIVQQSVCSPATASYEEYADAARRAYAGEVDAARAAGFIIPAEPGLLDRREYERRRTFAGYECRRLVYTSDGLNVVGYIWKPKDVQGKRLPLIVYSRGGNREGGRLAPWQQYGSSFGLFPYVTSGFIVMATQYRGVEGGQGREEFGGADVHDVLSLLAVAGSLEYVDMKNVFLLGWSRGGMETYLALKAGAGVNAAAVAAGVTDLVAHTKRHPDNTSLYKELIPAFDANPDQALRDRSALYWADRITTPLLILQGGADWRVDAATQTFPFAQRLHELGRTYELIVYAGDNHGLVSNREDADRRTIDWFRRFMK